MTREGLISVYEQIGYITIAIGVVVLLVSPLVKRLMHLDTLKDEDTAEERQRKHMKSNFRWSILAAPLALVACSNTSEAPKSASAVPAEKPLTLDKNPYPSTYKPYPGVATAIRNVTIFDGEGGRIENGVVFFANGKVSGVGGADTAIPEGTRSSMALARL